MTMPAGLEESKRASAGIVAWAGSGGAGGA